MAETTDNYFKAPPSTTYFTVLVELNNWLVERKKQAVADKQKVVSFSHNITPDMEPRGFNGYYIGSIIVDVEDIVN